MRTGEAEIYPIVPLESWRMRYDGVARRVLMADLAAGPLTDGPTERVKVDLIGTATSPAFGKGARHRMEVADHNLAVSGSGIHIEQSMHVTGTVEIHGEVIHFDAIGHRDHSCGPRHNHHMWRESWVNGTFPDGRIFHCVQVFVTGRPVYFMGYVWRGTEFLPVFWSSVAPAVLDPPLSIVSQAAVIRLRQQCWKRPRRIRSIHVTPGP